MPDQRSVSRSKVEFSTCAKWQVVVLTVTGLPKHGTLKKGIESRGKMRPGELPCLAFWQTLSSRGSWNLAIGTKALDPGWRSQTKQLAL